MSTKVSLILTTYNCASDLVRTLESIEKQDYPDIEVCIKDGASTDGTLKTIRAYEKRSRFPVKWISEKDGGIYDAMNKGYALSEGEIVAFFNEQFLSDHVVSKMAELISETPDPEGGKIVGAHADLVYATDEKIIRYWHMGPQKSLLTGWMPGHPTLFLKREIYEKYGLYDTSFRIAADYEFMLRFLKDKENRLAYLPETIIRMYYGGTSTESAGSYLDSLREGHRAVVKNGIRPSFSTDMLRTLRVLLQFVRREKK